MTTPLNKRLKLLNPEEEIRKHAMLAELGKPFDDSYRIGLCKGGLRYALHYAEHCLGWIWHQWLIGTPPELIRKEVDTFVERGLELRQRADGYEKLPHHDLLLLHCAILASNEKRLNEVATAIADVDGDKGKKPIDIGGLYALATGELYAAAWCGFLKHSILGDEKKANDHYDLIWKAHKDPELVAAPKALASAWRKKDWNVFIKQQEKDFERLWTRARKNNWSVKAEDSEQVVVATRGYRIGHMWCWSHCGLAVLANRQGIEVLTDHLWFPDYALKCTSV